MLQSPRYEANQLLTHPRTGGRTGTRTQKAVKPYTRSRRAPDLAGSLPCASPERVERPPVGLGNQRPDPPARTELWVGWRRPSLTPSRHLTAVGHPLEPMPGVEPGPSRYQRDAPPRELHRLVGPEPSDSRDRDAYDGRSPRLVHPCQDARRRSHGPGSVFTWSRTKRKRFGTSRTESAVEDRAPQRGVEPRHLDS